MAFVLIVLSLVDFHTGDGLSMLTLPHDSFLAYFAMSDACLSMSFPF
jgi:hypothetical protein